MTRAGRLRGGIGALPVLALLLAWAGSSALGLVPPALLPSPLLVAQRCLASLADPAFLGHAAATLRRLLSGFALALAIGVSAGLLAASSRVADAVLTPVVRLLAPLPKIALYPALILWLGFGDAAKVALVAADAAFPILIATRGAAAALDRRLVWSARAAGTSRLAILPRVVLPASLPGILTGARVGLVVGCIVVFLAEMIASTDGLGFLLVRAGRTFQTADMIVPLVAISALGLALNGGMTLLRRRLLAGFPGEGPARA